MRRKTVKCIPALLAVMLLLTGCWDATDIEDKNIVTAVILDARDDGYSFFAEIADISSNARSNVDASQSSGSFSASGFSFVQAEGKDLIELRNNLDLQMDKPIYLDTTRTLILSERAAEKDLKEYLFRLRSDVQYRQKVKVFITREEAEALTRSRTENDISFGFAVDNMLEHLIQNGQAFSRTSARYVDNLMSRSGFCIPCVDLEKTSVVLSGYFVIGYEGNAIGFIPTEETKGLIIMKADAAKQNYIVPLGDNNATVQADVVNSGITPHYQDGAVSFRVEYGVNATVKYFKKDIQPMDPGTEQRIKSELTRMIKKDVEDTIARSQKEFKCDYLQFDDVFRGAYPQEFEEMDWEKAYPDAQMDVKINVDLRTDPRVIYNPPGE